MLHLLTYIVCSTLLSSSSSSPVKPTSSTCCRSRPNRSRRSKLLRPNRGSRPSDSSNCAVYVHLHQKVLVLLPEKSLFENSPTPDIRMNSPFIAYLPLFSFLSPRTDGRLSLSCHLPLSYHFTSVHSLIIIHLAFFLRLVCSRLGRHDQDAPIPTHACQGATAVPRHHLYGLDGTRPEEKV